MRAPRVNGALENSEGRCDSETAFRNLVRNVTAGNGKVLLVCSYDRGTLGQTGSGHFSPIGANDQQTDKVLLLDVARFKPPTHTGSSSNGPTKQWKS